MTVVEALRSAQYVTDITGQRTAVVLPMQSWQSLLNWIEDVADAQDAAEALSALQAAGGRPQEAGWLAWDAIREDWEDEDEAEIASSAL
jgi:hypothetical protein